MQTLCLALLVPGFWNGNYNINSTSYLQAAQPVHEGAGNSGTHIHKINNKAFLIRVDFFYFFLGTDQNSSIFLCCQVLKTKQRKTWLYHFLHHTVARKTTVICMFNHHTQYREPSCKTIFLKTWEERTVSLQQCYKLILGVNRKVLKVEGQDLFLLSID